MPERGSKTSTVSVVWANLEFFYGAIQVISCSDWWPRKKPGYITTTRRQSNNQLSGGIAAHPVQNNSKWKNPLENFSPRFFGTKTVFFSLIIFQRAKLSTQRITHLCWWNWRTFWRKNATGSSPRGSSSYIKIPRLTGHLQPRRNWPTWASNVLITHPILRFWPRLTTPVLWTEKTIESSPLFFRRGGHCCRGDLDRQASFWNFFEWLA